MNDEEITLPLPMVLDEIVLQLGLRGRLFNFEIYSKKCLDEIGVPLGPHSATNIVKKEFQAQIPLILDDHVVKNHTSSHGVNETYLVPKTS
jgi:hypothetical protein